MRDLSVQGDKYHWDPRKIESLPKDFSSSMGSEEHKLKESILENSSSIEFLSSKSSPSKFSIGSGGVTRLSVWPVR